MYAETPITDLTIDFHWYQKAQNLKIDKDSPRLSMSFSGPDGKWEGELYSELINNPRLIAKRINILYPPSNPTQGTWETPEQTVSKLPELLQNRVRFVDRDLDADRIAARILEPIKNDIKEDLNGFGDHNFNSNLKDIQALIRGTIVSIKNPSMLDVDDGLSSLSNFILQVDYNKLSDKSKFYLNTLKDYYSNYYRTQTGMMSILKSVGPNIGAPEVLEKMSTIAEIDDIIAERNKIGQIIGLSKVRLDEILKKVMEFIRKNDKYIRTGVQTSGLILPQGKNLDKIYDSLKLIGMNEGAVPLLNLHNSRTLAMVSELKSLNPTYRFSHGVMSTSLNFLINNPNFFTIMQHPLTLRDCLMIRKAEITKQPNITIDLKPEI